MGFFDVGALLFVLVLAIGLWLDSSYSIRVFYFLFSFSGFLILRLRTSWRESVREAF